MSLVVAIKKDGVVYMGADTRCTRGERKTTNLAKINLKIKRVGDCYVGSAGKVAILQRFTENSEWFNLEGKELTKRFLVQNVVSRYYDIVKDMEKPNDNGQEKENPHFDCGFIVTDGKRIFTVDSDLEVNEQSSWAAIGCTEMMAYACFMGAAHNEEPNETILKSLRVSTRRNDGVGAPFILVNTLDNEIEIVEE
jgi:ATP-dependent protease HslVU (ClpYQ) peptidase subunit